MYRPKIANNAVTTLATSIATIGQTSVTLTSSVKFPDLVDGEWYYITVVDAANVPEVMIVTAKVGSVLTVQRAKDGTAARTFAAGSTVSMNPNAGYLEKLAARDGSDASGTWPIGIEGNAGTVTDGVYTAGDQTIGGTKTFSSPIVGDLSGNAATADLADVASFATHAYSAVAGGSSVAITATFAPNITALEDGTRVRLKGAPLNTSTSLTFAAGTTSPVPVKTTSGMALSVGVMPSDADLLYSAALGAWVLMNPLSDLAAASFTAAIDAGTLTLALAPCVSTFRSASLTDGSVRLVRNDAELSLLLPQAASLGASNGVASTMVLMELLSGTSKELAVMNLSGFLAAGMNGRELISTTAMSAAATSASVIYSATARTNVSYRVRGLITHTQTLAGFYNAPMTRLDPVNVGLRSMDFSKPSDFSAAGATCTYTGSLVETAGFYVRGGGDLWTPGTWDLGANRVMVGIRVASEDYTDADGGNVAVRRVYVRGINIKNN